MVGWDGRLELPFVLSPVAFGGEVSQTGSAQPHPPFITGPARPATATRRAFNHVSDLFWNARGGSSSLPGHNQLRVGFTGKDRTAPNINTGARPPR